MLTIGYKKTAQGMRVVSVEEFDPNRAHRDVVEWFQFFFQGALLFGGREWKTLPVEKIVTIFKDAAKEIHRRIVERCDKIVDEHAKRNRVVRWWKELRGWHPPVVPSIEEIEKDMAGQCRELAAWMRRNQHRRFYAGVDMSDFIVKPEAVAKILDPST